MQYSLRSLHQYIRVETRRSVFKQAIYTQLLIATDQVNYCYVVRIMSGAAQQKQAIMKRVLKMVVQHIYSHMRLLQ